MGNPERTSRSSERPGHVTAWISLGSNLGPSRVLLRSALDHVGRLERTSVTGVSSLYETPPWGDTDQDAFLNAVARLDTGLGPGALLSSLLDIEGALGRRRDGERRWGPRHIDLDLLLHGDHRVVTPELVLPHPRMAERAFVLVPLADLAPDLELPGHGMVRDCLARLGREGIREIAGPGWCHD